MENYIVRIYRRTNNNPDSITGIVEKTDSSEKISFHNNEEFINIFLPPESTISPNNKQQIIEQRKYRRFNVKDITLLFDATTDVGEIIDISMGGLSFFSPNTLDDSKGPFKVGLLCEGAEDFCTGKIKCNKLMSLQTGMKSQEPRKRFSIEFDALNKKQEIQVAHIIQNYCHSEV